MVAFALKVAFPGEMSRQAGLSLQEIVHQYLYPNDNPMRELWFIATLFWLMMLAPFWELVLKKEWLMWAMLAVMTVLHFWHPNIEFLCIGRAFRYGIWFYLGLVVCMVNAVERVLDKVHWSLLIVGIAIYVLGCYIVPFITTLGGIIFSFGLALIADRYVPKLFFSFRNYTYQIFLMGIFAQMAVKILFRHVTIPYFLAYILCIIVGLYVPVVLAKIVEKINWKPLSLCYGLK